MADFTAPQPLQALLVDASQAPWLNEKDEAAASWDDASLPDRQSVAAWVRTWSEGDEIARVKEVMVGVDARIEAAFSVEAAAKFRRWAAGVLLDVFGSSDDLADSIMMPQQRPKFKEGSPSLTQFERFEHYDDLWEGEDSRADELSEWIERKAALGSTNIDDAPAVLTRWVVAISIAELVHMRTSAKRAKRAEAQKARRTLLDKAAELRTAVGRPPDDDEDDEDEDGEWDDDEATTPTIAAAAPAQSPEPPKPEETKEPPAKAVRKPLPKADAARHATHVGEFYENDDEDARTRHARGYDPLDKHAQRVAAEVDGAKERRDALYASRVLFFFTCLLLLRRWRADWTPPRRLRRVDGVLTVRVRLDAVAASAAYQQYRARRRAAVQDHVAAMRSRGLVFDVEFPERSLGLRVALAKYGESGRRFVVVDSTERGSACFESVKPGDELCAVNGAAVVDPDEESIETLKSAIANAPRPLVITFIEGEDRDHLFAAQEAQRGGKASSRKAPPATKKRADIYSAPRDAQLVIIDRDAQYRGHICEDGSTLKDAKGARLLVVDAALGVATDDGGVLVGKVSVNETDAALVGIEDARGRLLGYADQGRSSVLDANKSTILEIDSAGECRGHDGLHVGSLVGFTYHHTKLVAFVFLLRPHLFRDKPKSFLRAMRKSASRASGAHGFFAKAA